LLSSKYFSSQTISFINDILEEKYILPFETLFQEGDYLEINLVIILEGKSKKLKKFLLHNKNSILESI
jgi:hypothetical protein